MVLETTKKGLKQPTKGAKLIQDENISTLKFYSCMAGGSLALTLLFSTFSFITILAILVQVASLGGMFHMSRPSSGIDLNLAGSFSDYVKDIILTTSICSILSIISRGFWLLWLWLPGFFCYKIWVGFIAPWIFEPAPEENTEASDKKKKKMERKMARAGYR